jgi:hypothetical protein
LGARIWGEGFGRGHPNGVVKASRCSELLAFAGIRAQPKHVDAFTTPIQRLYDAFATPSTETLHWNPVRDPDPQDKSDIIHDLDVPGTQTRFFGVLARFHTNPYLGLKS